MFIFHLGDDLTSIPENYIETFFNESSISFYSNFEERSQRMFSNFISLLEETVMKDKKVKTIYFHNMSKFDGIFILKYYADRGDHYIIKPLGLSS